MLLGMLRVLGAEDALESARSDFQQLKGERASALARELRAPVFSMDWQMGALVPFGVLRKDNLEPLSELMWPRSAPVNDAGSARSRARSTPRLSAWSASARTDRFTVRG
jgi:hypothetical protein